MPVYERMAGQRGKSDIPIMKPSEILKIEYANHSDPETRSSSELCYLFNGINDGAGPRPAKIQSALCRMTLLSMFGIPIPGSIVAKTKHCSNRFKPY